MSSVVAMSNLYPLAGLRYLACLVSRDLSLLNCEAVARSAARVGPVQDKESLVKVSMVVTPAEEALQKATFEVTWTDEESGVAKKAKKVRSLSAKLVLWSWSCAVY